MNTSIKSTWRQTPPVLAREHCHVCHGTGWELLALGGSSQARRCQCGELDRLLKLKERVRIPPRYEECMFSSFIPDTLSQTRALAEARRFAERYPEVTRGLFFAGPSGVGKTHLAVAILRYLVERFHEDILFVDFESLLCLYPGLRLVKSEQGGEWERLKEVSLLVLDNFGSGPRDEGVIELTQEILRSRWLWKKPTVYTGAPLSCRALFRSSEAGRQNPTPTQGLLSSLPSRTLVDLLTGVKIVPMHGGASSEKGFVANQLF